ncbi:universal stress protein [Aeromicrobium wangtongii]|uniref:universal stress protein n=1 Tax=Aeromicrobium wangtongii TaxID=2969247 RepID=UPI002017E30E|nr:universal stress protein [Aeromicrobium wangtongii]MCL3820363.1 universal stress protein [Aeromicrobium wangtongii]
MSTRPVVLGDDGTRDAVLEFALAEAQRRHAPLKVVHCAPTPLDPTDVMPSEALSRELLAAGQEVLDGTRQLIEQRAAELDVEYVLSDRAPIEFLLEESETAQLLVTGIDDIPWYDRLFGGAVATYLSAHALCPLVTVPKQLDESQRHEGVVVALDGTSGARPLLSFAFEVAQEWGAPLHAVRMVPVGATPDYHEIARANLSEVLAGWAEDYPDVRVDQEIIVSQPSAGGIAATRRAQLVLVGRSGKHGMHRPTASSLVRHAACPVAVVPLDPPTAP